MAVHPASWDVAVLVRTPVESAFRMGGSIGAAVVSRGAPHRPRRRRDARRALAVAARGGSGRAPGGEPARRAGAQRRAPGAARGGARGDLVRYRVADRLLSEGLVEQTMERVLDGEELEYVVQAALESPTVERLIGQRSRAACSTRRSCACWRATTCGCSSTRSRAAPRSPPRSRSRASASPTRWRAEFGRARAARTHGSSGAHGGHFGVARRRHPTRGQGEPRGQPTQPSSAPRTRSRRPRRPRRHSRTWASSPARSPSRRTRR